MNMYGREEEKNFYTGNNYSLLELRSRTSSVRLALQGLTEETPVFIVTVFEGIAAVVKTPLLLFFGTVSHSSLAAARDCELGA